MSGSVTNEEILEKIEALRSIAMASVTGGVKDEDGYLRLRCELLTIHWIKTGLPRFIRTSSDLSQVWHEITMREAEPGTVGSGIYKRRRTLITEEFAPLINHLQGSGPAPEVFFPKGSEHDAYVHIRAIFGQAQEDLFVIDPYVDGSIYQLLGTISAAAMAVRILTLKVPTISLWRSRNSSSSIPNLGLRRAPRRISTTVSSSWTKRSAIWLAPRLKTRDRGDARFPRSMIQEL